MLNDIALTTLTEKWIGGEKVLRTFDQCAHRQITSKQELNFNPTVREVPCVLSAAGAYWLLISIRDRT